MSYTEQPEHASEGQMAPDFWPLVQGIVDQIDPSKINPASDLGIAPDRWMQLSPDQQRAVAAVIGMDRYQSSLPKTDQ